MKQEAKKWLSKSRARALHEVAPIRQRLHGTLSRDELSSALADAGVVPGATVMAHVSMNAVRRAAPTVDPLALIALFKGLLTPDGTLLVMTSPFVGLEADYVATSPSFDVRRTPSRMGLMTELLRRMPDTQRSLHPTHAVAGWGARAAELLASHHRGETFAETSPFCLMTAVGGRVMGVGAGIRNGYTIIHAAEYLHPDARDYAFSSRHCTLTVTDGDRSTSEYSFRALKGGLDRHIPRIERKLQASETVVYKRHRGLLISSASSAAMIKETMTLISDGIFYRSSLPGAA